MQSQIRTAHMRSQFFAQGGAEKSIRILFGNIANDEFEMSLICVKSRHVGTGTQLSLADYLKQNGSKVLEIPWKGTRLFKAVALIRKYVKDNQIGILHSHDNRCNFLALLAAIGSPVVTVTTIHGWIWNSLKLCFLSMFDQVIVRFFDYVISPSFAKKRALLSMGLPGEKIVVIHNCAQPSITCDAERKRILRAELEIGEKDKVIGAIGRLSTEKGHEYLIRALPQLVPKFRKLKVVLVGDGPLRGKLANLADHLGVQSYVRLIGHRQDETDICAFFDILAQPSLTENMPLAIIEAMSLGKCIVASDVGGVAELVTNGDNGLLVKPRDPEALAQALESLLQAPERIRKMGRRSFELFQEEYTVDRYVLRMEDFYRKISDCKIEQACDQVVGFQALK